MQHCNGCQSESAVVSAGEPVSPQPQWEQLQVEGLQPLGLPAPQAALWHRQHGLPAVPDWRQVSTTIHWDYNSKDKSADRKGLTNGKCMQQANSAVD